VLVGVGLGWGFWGVPEFRKGTTTANTTPTIMGAINNLIVIINNLILKTSPPCCSLGYASLLM